MKKRLILLAAVLVLLLANWIVPAAAEEVGTYGTYEETGLYDDQLFPEESSLVSYSAFSSPGTASSWQDDWEIYGDQLEKADSIAYQLYEKLESDFMDDLPDITTADVWVNGKIETYYVWEMELVKLDVPFFTGSSLDEAKAKWSSWVSSTLTSELAHAGIAFTNDHPEYFWLRHAFVYSNGYSYEYNGSGYTLYPYAAIRYIVQAETDSKAKIAAYQTSLDSTVETIKAQTTGLRPDEQVALFDQWLAANVHYDVAAVSAGVDVDETPWSVIGSLVKGQAVCEGYAKALQLLCHEAGIPCVTVSGKGTNNGRSEDHMWAAVKLDGLWYFCDPTWDDPVYYKDRPESTMNTSTQKYLLTTQPASHLTGQELIAPPIADEPYAYDPPKGFVVNQTTGELSGTETSTEQVRMLVALYDKNHRMIACGVCEEKTETSGDQTTVYIYSAPDFDVNDVKTAYRVVRFILESDHTPKGDVKNLIG